MSGVVVVREGVPGVPDFAEQVRLALEETGAKAVVRRQYEHVKLRDNLLAF